MIGYFPFKNFKATSFVRMIEKKLASESREVARFRFIFKPKYL